MFIFQVLNKEVKPITWNFYIDRGADVVPKYEKPVMRYCKLPGEIYYFCVVRPGRRIPLEIAICMENYVS